MQLKNCKLVIIKRYEGITSCKIFNINCEDSEYDFHVPENIAERAKKVWVTFDNEIYYPTFVNDTFNIEGDVFLNEMIEELKLFEKVELNKLKIENLINSKKEVYNFYKMGNKNNNLGKLTIHHLKINSLKEIKRIENKLIFNCMGYYSKNVFPDKNIYPQKGNMICFQNTTNVSNFYSILLGDGQRVHVYPGVRRVGIGISRVDKEFDKKEDEQTRLVLMNNAMRFFKPKL